MARICDLSGKRAQVGNKISHSNRKTKRRFYPNLKKRKIYVPELKQWIDLKISNHALRTINKKGISNCLNQWAEKGYIN